MVQRSHFEKPKMATVNPFDSKMKRILMAMHKKNQDINVTQAKGAPEEQRALTQNVFVGSTAELQKMLRGDNEKVIEHDNDRIDQGDIQAP